MRKMDLLTVLLFITVIFLYGCGGEQAGTPKETDRTVSAAEVNSVTETMLYENHEAGIRISQASGWDLEKEITAPFNAVFGNGRLKAIITVISNDLSNDDIKHELKSGAGNVSILEEEGNYISFATGRTESIRSDIYIYEDSRHKRILTFMTPVSDYDENKELIAEFRESVTFN